MPTLVKVGVSPDKSLPDPALFPSWGWLGAAVNHLLKGLVDAESELSASNGALESSGHVELVQRQDSPRVRRPPGDRIFGPRKDAFWVGLEKTLRREILGNRHQAVTVGMGRIGERVPGAEEGNRKLQGAINRWGALDEGV